MDDARIRTAAANLKAMCIEGVRILALDAEAQVRWFPAFVPTLDELIRSLGDPIDMMTDSALRSACSAEALADFNALLARITRLVTRDTWLDRDSELLALKSDDWNSARALARDILVRNGWSGPPTGGFTTFTPS